MEEVGGRKVEKSRIYFRDRESRRGSLNGTRERERNATTRWKIYVFSREGIGWILLNLLELNAIGHLRKGKLEGRFIPQLFRPARRLFTRVIFHPIANDMLCFLLRKIMHDFMKMKTSLAIFFWMISQWKSFFLVPN